MLAINQHLPDIKESAWYPEIRKPPSASPIQLHFTMTTASLHPIVAFNNRAGSSLASGEYEMAISLYRNAIIRTELNLLQGNTANNDNDLNSDISPDRRNPSDVKTSLPPVKPVPASSSIAENINETHDTEFVYRSPILFSQEDIDEQEYDEPGIHCEILFNMALTYHLWALDDSLVSSKKQYRLKKALKLYEYSFSMQTGLGFMSITTLLALVNNCASIYKLLEKTERAEKFYNHMLSTLMAMIEIGEASEVDELDGFLHNACRIILQDVAAPAA
jgi:tetratricopeptide (TPR) repeat protein